jgi:hypothetical protein
MARSSGVPSYRLHKQSGQAIVTLTDGVGGRHDILLGRHGTPESRAEYARVIAEWEAAGRRLPTSTGRRASSDLTVNELLLAYWRHAEGYYVKDGQPTSQLDRIQRSLGVVRHRQEVPVIFLAEAAATRRPGDDVEFLVVAGLIPAIALQFLPGQTVEVGGLRYHVGHEEGCYDVLPGNAAIGRRAHMAPVEPCGPVVVGADNEETLRQ